MPLTALQRQVLPLLAAHRTTESYAGGGAVIWDLSHAAGLLELRLKDRGVTCAVGCGYKFLNGGPGAPAFVYVERALADGLHQPLSGWMGHARPFDFAPDYAPAPGVQRFAAGTPPILSLCALDAALDAFNGVRMSDVERKARRLGDLFLEGAAALGLHSVSPPSAKRGGQISLRHEAGYAIMQALIARGVIGDFRAPNILRFGFAPLYTRFTDAWDAVDHIEGVLRAGSLGHPEPEALVADVQALLAGRGVAPVFPGPMAHLAPDMIERLVVIDAAVPGLAGPAAYMLSPERVMKVWHFYFNALPDLPAALTEGRERTYIEYILRTRSADFARTFSKEDVDEYVGAYARPGAMDRGFAYYRAIFKNMADNIEMAKTKLTLPILAIGGEHWLGPIMQASFDPVGGTLFDDALSSLGWGGRYVHVGFVGGIPKIPANRLLVKHRAALGSSLRYFRWRAHDKLEQSVSALLDWYGQGKLRPLVTQEWPLERGIEAIKLLTDRKGHGRILLSPRTTS